LRKDDVGHEHVLLDGVLQLILQLQLVVQSELVTESMQFIVPQTHVWLGQEQFRLQLQQSNVSNSSQWSLHVNSKSGVHT